jgi:hypothetical protein
VAATLLAMLGVARLPRGIAAGILAVTAAAISDGGGHADVCGRRALGVLWW